MTTFVKLKRFNDWGADYWALPGKGLSAHGTANIREYALPLEGKKLIVKWPDGTVGAEMIYKKFTQVDVHDHGHVNQFQCPVYYVKKHMLGLDINLDISSLEFDLHEIEALSHPPPGEK